MKGHITNIESGNDGVIVTMKIWWRTVPRPQREETEAAYHERVRDIVADIYAYDNLHAGAVIVSQEEIKHLAPTIDNYDS